MITRFQAFAVASLIGIVSIIVLSCAPRRASPSVSPPSPVTNNAVGINKIEHFIFIMQENRSFDSYFGTYPGAEGLPGGIAFTDPHDGSMVSLYHDPNDVNRGGPHGWDNAQEDIDNGKMDGFLKEAYKGQTIKGQPFSPCNTPGKNPKDVMGWHDSREIPNYWNYAHLYVLQDHMFESVASYSLPAHLYMLAAQSGGYTGYKQAKPATYNFPEIT